MRWIRGSCLRFLSNQSQELRMFTKKLHNDTIDIVGSLQKKERVHAEKKVRQSFHGAAGEDSGGSEKSCGESLRISG